VEKGPLGLGREKGSARGRGGLEVVLRWEENSVHISNESECHVTHNPDKTRGCMKGTEGANILNARTERGGKAEQPKRTS